MLAALVRAVRERASRGAGAAPSSSVVGRTAPARLGDSPRTRARHNRTLAAEPVHSVATSARLADLARALVQEQRLIEELRQALLRQRTGIATGDPEMIGGSDHAIARTRLTLEEARRRRALLATAVVGRPGVALSDLESFVGVLPASLLAALEAVHRAAEVTAQELAINQRMVRQALEAGDAFLQQLFSGASRPSDPPPQGGTR